MLRGTRSCRAYLKLDCLLSETALKERHCDDKYSERDWIIESLNEDKGYDAMVVEMLAADELAPEDEDALRATGFPASSTPPKTGW